MSTPLSSALRRVLTVTGLVDVVVGLLFLLGPELEVSLWPSPISPVLTRFIGAIIIGNGLGLWIVARQGTWEGARALFVVGLAYAVIVLMAIPPQLLSADVDRSLWAYVAFSAVFAIAIVFLIWGYEKRSRGKGAAD